MVLTNIQIGDKFNGLINNFRLNNSILYYSAGFVPSTELYNINGTVLLIKPSNKKLINDELNNNITSTGEITWSALKQ